MTTKEKLLLGIGRLILSALFLPDFYKNDIVKKLAQKEKKKLYLKMKLKAKNN